MQWWSIIIILLAMYSPHVFGQTTLVRARELTEVTGEWFLACVRPNVPLDHCGLVSAIVTLVTNEFKFECIRAVHGGTQPTMFHHNINIVRGKRAAMFARIVHVPLRRCICKYTTRYGSLSVCLLANQLYCPQQYSYEAKPV